MAAKSKKERRDKLSLWWALKTIAKKKGRDAQYNYFDKKIKAAEKKG